MWPPRLFSSWCVSPANSCHSARMFSAGRTAALQNCPAVRRPGFGPAGAAVGRAKCWLCLGGPQSTRVSLTHCTGGGCLVCPQRPAAAGSEPATRTQADRSSQLHSLKAPTLRFLRFTRCQICGLAAACPEATCFFSQCASSKAGVRCLWWCCAVGSRWHHQHHRCRSHLCLLRFFPCAVLPFFTARLCSEPG